MTDSGSSGEEECHVRREKKARFVFYRDRPQWKDIVPMPQDDGPNPVVAISYSDKFKDVYDYCRAILAKKEKSERALELTKDALNLNPANYTIWQFRREILKHLKLDLRKELEFSGEMIYEHPKNYQVWYHRKAVIEMLGDPSKELELTNNDILLDTKNYHSWQHRQWVVQTYGLFEGELEFCERLLNEDVRNNSAWNHRYFAVVNTTGFTPEVIEREVEYTLDCISKATHNESAWNYLRGILEKSKVGISGDPKVLEYCQALAATNCNSPHLYIFLMDVHSARAKSDPAASQEAKELCRRLANDIDPIRQKYWEFLAQQIE